MNSTETERKWQKLFQKNGSKWHLKCLHQTAPFCKITVKQRYLSNFKTYWQRKFSPVWDLSCENSLASSCIKSEARKEQQERKGSSGFWFWMAFPLHQLIPVLHFSGFILPACLHHCCIEIKYFVWEMTHNLSSVSSDACLKQSVCTGRVLGYTGKL